MLSLCKPVLFQGTTSDSSKIQMIEIEREWKSESESESEKKK